jgi:sugar phosphate permease
MTQQRFFPWFLLVLGSFFVLYQFLLQSANSVMVAPLAHDFNTDFTGIGFLSASFFYSYVLLQIPAGLLVDRFGARMLMVVGCLICAVAAILFGCARHLNDAIAMRLLMGLASSPAVVGVMYLACRWFPKERFVLLAALVEAIGMFGGALGETSLAALLNHTNWRTSMIIVGIAGIVLALLLFWVVRDQPEQLAHDPCKKISAKELCQRFMEALTHRAVWIGCLYGAFSFSVIAGFGGLWAIPFLEHVQNLSMTQSALVSSMIFIGAALGSGSSGFLACYKVNIRYLMLSTSVLASIIMAYIIFSTQSFYVNALLFLILGMCTGCYALSFAYVKLNTCETIGASAMGLTNMMCLLLGAPILQPVAGHLLAHLSASGEPLIKVYRLGMLPFLVTLILAFLVALLVKRTR